MTFTYKFPRPAFTVDAVILHPLGDKLLLLKRKNEPFQNQWALPGGFVEIDEQGIEAVKREVKEECNLDVNPLIEIGCFDQVDRDPRGRVITLAFLCEIGNTTNLPKAGSDASEIAWFPFSTLPKLAFDHSRIIVQALAKANKEVIYLHQQNLPIPRSIKNFVRKSKK